MWGTKEHRTTSYSIPQISKKIKGLGEFFIIKDICLQFALELYGEI
jgi:hypothetical protein